MIFLYYSVGTLFPLIAIATTKSELTNEQSQNAEDIENTKTEIESIQEEISTQLEEAKKLTNKISEYESEIEDLEDQIKDLESQIKEAEENITAQEKEYERQKALLDEKVISMAERGETTYLDVLLASASLSEMISNYYLLSEVVDYDLQMMDEVQNKKQEIENEKAELEKDKEKLDNSKDTLESKMGQLKVAKKEKEASVAKLTDDEKTAQKQLEELEEDQKEIQKELARIAEEERKAAEAAAAAGKTTSSITQITGNPSASGYIFPLSGKSKSNITTGYGSYSWGGNHTGVDIAISAGTPIYAVKAGTVTISKALKNSDGSYRSFGEYIAISHGDGTTTLYCHGLSGSRLVKEGDTVKQGQQIMSVGSTGNSTGPHLHFEVRINGVSVNPTPYLP
jgi:murein DD-endopeptidase MepM/ murein hydrolase activator NlpD